MESQPEPLEGTKQVLRATLLLVALFCAFFWLGFLVGKNSVPQTASAPARIDQPKAERLQLQLAGALNQQVITKSASH